MNFRKKRYWIPSSIVLTLAVLKCYDKIIEGFYPYRINPPAHLNEIVSLPQDITPLPLEALSQNYYYLASGSQCFAFISQDQKYILKFFKHYRWKEPFYTHMLTSSLKDKKKEKRLEGLKATYDSCLLYQKFFAEKTALRYLQLLPSKAPDFKLNVFNRLGVKHEIFLNKTPFVLQYRANSTAETLQNLRKLQKHALAKQYLQSLFQNVTQKRDLGFTDKDPHFFNNFGFIGSEAICFDIGGLTKDPIKDDRYFCEVELKKIETLLTSWLKDNYPELLPDAETLIEQTKKKYAS